MIARLPLVLLALVTLPFVTFWLDYEFARRILLCIGVGIAMIVANLKGPRFPIGVATSAFLVLLVWAFLSGWWATNPLLCAWKVGYFAALWGCLQIGLRGTPEHWIRGVLPVTATVSALGLAQALGLDWPTGVRITEAPASTLGNLNVASEVVSLGVAASLLALRDAGRRPLALAALVLGAAYLVVNGSRSGQLAASVALAIALLAPGTTPLARRSAPLLLGTILGVALGLGANLLRPAHEEPKASAANPAVVAEAAAPSTLAVRKELWLGTLALAMEQPLRGQGAGQFRIEYPRYRRDAEIELSSFSRSFRTTVDTAHNDLLELAVEFGVWGVVTGLVLAAALAWAAFRSGSAFLAPLVAFGVLAMVRSPLTNAPAAAWLFGYAGALLARRGARLVTIPRLGGVAAIVLVWIGMVGGAAVALRTELAAADYLQQRATGQPSSQALRQPESMVRRGYSEPRLVGLVARHYAATLAPKAALDRLDVQGFRDFETVPNEPGLWLLRATVAHAAGRDDLAIEALDLVHRLDPRDPEAALLRAVLHTEQGDAASVLTDLVVDAHPKLRAGLAKHLADLAKHAEERGNQATALRLLAEQAFVLALDQVLAATADQQRLAALGAIDAVREAFALASLERSDARPNLLRAAAHLARGQEQLARDLGEQAVRKQLTVPKEARELVRAAAEPLRRLKEWESLLAW